MYNYAKVLAMSDRGRHEDHRCARRRFLRTAGSTLAGGSAALAGCLSSVTDRGSGGESLPSELVIGHPSPARPIYNVPVYARFKERMEERGVSLKQKTFKGYTPLIAGMVRGEVDIAETSLPSLVKSRRENFPIVAFCGWTQQYVRALLVRNSVEEWSDIEGKALVGHSENSLTNLVLREMVHQELGESANVEYTNIIGTPNRIASLQGDEFEATGVFEAGARQATADGVGTILAHAWDYFDDQTIAVWGALQDNLDENEELYGVVTKELVNSYRSLYDRAAEDVIDELDLTVGFPEYDTSTYVETLRAATKNEVWPTDPDSMLTAEKITRSQEIMERVGIIEEPIDPTAAVDKKFL